MIGILLLPWQATCDTQPLIRARVKTALSSGTRDRHRGDLMEGAIRRSHKNRVTISILLLCMALLGGPSLAAEHSQIVEGSRVTLLYQITASGSPSVIATDEFVQGQHKILPAVEREIAGMKPGEEKRVDLTVEESFGPYDDRKYGRVLRSELPPGVKKGSILKDSDGNVAIVTDLSSRAAVLDFNHPLAGKPLIVQIKILKVENPS